MADRIVTAQAPRANGRAVESVLLEVEELHVSYGGVRALRGVSLTVPEREHRRRARQQRRRQEHAAAAISGRPRRCSGGAVDGGSVRLGGPDADAHGPGRRRARRRRAGARGPAHVRRPDRRGEPARRRLRAPRAATSKAEALRARRSSLFPRLQERRHPARRPALRRRAADAGHRPRADGEPRCCCSTSRRSASRRSSSSASPRSSSASASRARRRAGRAERGDGARGRRPRVRARGRRRHARMGPPPSSPPATRYAPATSASRPRTPTSRCSAEPTSA